MFDTNEEIAQRHFTKTKHPLFGDITMYFNTSGMKHIFLHIYLVPGITSPHSEKYSLLYLSGFSTYNKCLHIPRCPNVLFTIILYPFLEENDLWFLKFSLYVNISD